MALIRKFRSESTNVEATKVCLNTDEFMTVANMRQEFLRMRSTNSHLKDSVRVLNDNNMKMRQEAHHQKLMMTSMMKAHENIVAMKEEEIRVIRMKATARSVAQDVISRSLNTIIKEQQDTASLTEELLLETRSDLTSSKAEAAKLRDELKTLKVELSMRNNDTSQMKELFKQQKRSLQKIHRKEVQALTEGFEQEIQKRNERERFLQEMIIRKNTEIEEVKKELATMNDIHEEEVKALKESFLQVTKDRDDKERLLQQTILLKNEEVASLRKDMTASKDIHEEEVKELQQTVHLDSLFVKDLMTVSSKIESEELERVRKDKETLEYEHNLTKARLEESETKLESLEKDGERLLSELNSMKTTLLKSWVDRNNETKIMEDRLYSVKAEREIFKVLATAKRNKEDEEEQITSNEHMERSRHHHQEQARYMGQAWQEATSGPCYFYTPDRNHHHHPG